LCGFKSFFKSENFKKLYKKYKKDFSTTLSPTNDLEEEAKDQFYEQLERAYAACASRDARRERISWPGNRTSANDRQACMGIQIKMASDWSTLLQAGKW
jgi:hypothetical protein